MSIEDFCNSHRVAAAIEQSNASPDYIRKLIEHKSHVMDAIEEIIHQVKMSDREAKALYNRGVVHDLSKLSLIEVSGYSGYNFKGENSRESQRLFDMAWNHHKNSNDHHPEYWLSVGRGGDVMAIEMEKLAMYEMVADWIGAGRSYGSSIEVWLPGNIGQFMFHETTARMLAVTLTGILGEKYIAKGNYVARGSR